MIFVSNPGNRTVTLLFKLCIILHLELKGEIWLHTTCIQFQIGLSSFMKENKKQRLLVALFL